MMLQYFTELADGIRDKLRHDPASFSHRKRFALEIADLGVRLYGGKARVAWCGVTTPFDLLNTMGVTSSFAEFTGAIMASTGGVGAILENAEQAGYAPDTCAYHRSVVGSALLGQLPEPDFLIGTTCPCAGGLATIENLARIFRKDLFVLHVPQDPAPNKVRYLADQIRDLVVFIEAHTGEKLDRNRLAEAVRQTNLIRELMIETFQLARRVPSPAGTGDLRDFGILMPLFWGTENGVEVARAFRDCLAARMRAGIGGSKEEKLRLMWVLNRVQYRTPLEKLLTEEFKAAIIFDELNTIQWDPIDPDDPFEGFARRAIAFPVNGPLERRIGLLQQQAREYRLDGALQPCHWGCRQGTGARGMIADGLRQVGVPVLNLEVDCVDPRKFTAGQLDTRLRAFLEMLEKRPSPRL